MKSIVRFFGFLFLIYLILSGLVGLLKREVRIDEHCEDSFEIINVKKDRIHHREWETPDQARSFCTSYQSIEKTSLRAEERRNRLIMQALGYKDLWGTVYRSLVKDSKLTIGFLADSLAKISREKKLKRADLAEMIITFVQDIPYSYILNVDCETYATGGKPCLGNIALGLLSPYEFIHTLYGDCDTRAVLIYTILEELGYDPMIVVSNQYAHAMLALNIPASGDHLTYRGNNYYFWETTAMGWPIGMLPPNTNNVNYWEIALVNEL